LFIKYITQGLSNHIFLSNKMQGNFEIVPKKLILNIGEWKKEVEVEFCDEIEEDTIGISEYVTRDFLIPDELSYEVKVDGRNIYVGPLIGFLIETKKKYLSPERLEKLREYYKSYDEIKGCLFLCAVDQINTSNKTIEGYYHDGRDWKVVVCPYPGCIYRKADIPKDIYDNLINSLGDRVFNSYFFDKWETWQLLSPYPMIKEHLPHTTKLKSLQDLDEMLSCHQLVYLKQTRGYKAKGILKVEKLEENYQFTYRLKGSVMISNKDEVSSLIKELNENGLSKNFYIVQQAVKVKRYQDRPYDFRVIMQKDGSRQWGCSGIIARFGKRASIATNFLLSGYALSGYEALKRVFSISEKEAFLKLQEIESLCTDVCRVLDNCIGNYGDLGIDVMVDEKQKVWILEINKTHDHRFPLYSINDAHMYNEVIANPLRYAKALAGFSH
jgi:hypothetical protein